MLLESLSGGTPVLWLEVAPPRGINTESLLNRLAAVRGHIGAINLADNALGRVKLSGLVFASLIKTRLDIPVVLNVSCRDRNAFALKSDLLGAAVIGIDAVVALQGDKLPASGSAGAGVLKTEFPYWIGDGALARIVLAWRPAAPQHGGDGAFYVLLRRKAGR